MHSLLAEQVPAERLRSTTDHAELSSADIILVAVQTPIDLCSKAPALDALRDAVASVGSHVRPGVLVIVESTVPPGTMRDLVVPLLERTAGLSADGDFLAGCCPERVMPGKLLANLRGCSRVMGGWTADAGRVGSALPYVDWRRDRRDGLYDGGVGMPRHVGQLAQNLLAGCGRRLSDARVVVLGYAYLEDSDDARNSPSADLVAWLERRGASVTVHDPLVAPFDVDLAQATRGPTAS